MLLNEGKYFCVETTALHNKRSGKSKLKDSAFLVKPTHNGFAYGTEMAFYYKISLILMINTIQSAVFNVLNYCAF